MDNTRTRQLVTLSLIFGAVVFGMVLAGGLDLTNPGLSSPQIAPTATTPQASQISGLPSFADLAAQLSPAVVSVEAVRISRAEGPRIFRRGPIDPFEFFFGPPEQRREREEEREEEFRSQSGGSGFLISPDGLVATNYHVVEGATELRIHFEERTYRAEIKGTDPATDIALLKIEADGDLPYLKLGDSDALRVGDWVMAIGNPLRLENTVTVGVVSAKGRRINITPDRSLENFIQTDAAINFGNSGGPLLNLGGEVVGMNTAINWGSENIGFAVPVSTLKEVLPQLQEKGEVRRGYLGIFIDELDYEDMQAFGLDSTAGALVQSVEEGGPADEAGLKHGDVIVSVDGRQIEDTYDLISHVSNKPPGAKVQLQVIRDGKTIRKQVELGERPGVESRQVSREEEGGSGIEWLGIQYQNLTPGLRSMHGLPEGVEGVWVTNVGAASPLFEEGIRAGDVITEVNGRAVGSVEEFEAAVNAAPSGSFLRLYVQRYDRRAPRPVSFFAVVRVP